MLIALAVLLSLAFIGWLIWRAFKRKPVKAHLVMYGLSILAGIYTLGFFLTMDIPLIIKVVICIVLGICSIFLATFLQRRRQPSGKSV
jgi:hypothetical protein